MEKQEKLEKQENQQNQQKQKAICIESLVPLRSDMADSSEMVSQLLFGETLSILETHPKWTKISCDFDGYVGFVDPKQIQPITDEEYEEILSQPTVLVSDAVAMVTEEYPKMLSFGSVLFNYNNKEISLGNKSFSFDGNAIVVEKTDKHKLVEFAKNYLNTPYLWGGRSIFGIDCSGLSQQVYKMGGFSLPRDASQQAELGEALGFVAEAEPGDLAFFDNKEGKIIHVGIVLSEGKIIHAHGKVRIDSLDNTGIYNQDLQRYTHNLRVIKKMM